MLTETIRILGLTLAPSRYVRIFGMSFYWFGLLFALGFLAAVIYAVGRAKAFGLKDDNVTDALILAVPVGIIGARIVYVLTHLSQFQGNAGQILKFWDGGLSLAGGLLFAACAAYLYCRKKKISFGAFLDLVGPAFLLGAAIASWGHFFNRDNLGIATSYPWGMELSVNGTVASVHPLFLYEFLWCLIGFISVLIVFSKVERKYDGQIFAITAGWYALYLVMIVPLELEYDGLFSWKRLLAALALMAAAVVLVQNRVHVAHRKTQAKKSAEEKARKEAEEAAEDAAEEAERKAEEERSAEDVPEDEAGSAAPAPDEDDDFEPFGEGAEDEDDGFEPFGEETEENAGDEAKD